MKMINLSLMLVALILLGPLNTRTYSQAPGNLDLTFDTDGMVTTDFAGGDDYANSVTMQPDGKILVAGYINNSPLGDFALARYNPDGSLDISFDIDGMVTTDFSSSPDKASAVVLQSDGKIILAGFNNSGSTSDFALVRYNSNGSLDTTFDNDGKVTTDFGNGDFAYAVIIQPDTKILVGGYTTSLFNDFALARYNYDGSLDTTFDIDGKLTTDFSNSQDECVALALQADGKILAAGRYHNGMTLDYAMTRYNPDGTLDSSFNFDGKLTTDFGFVPDFGNSIAIQSDGKILFAGFSNGTGLDFSMARYTTAGSLDPTFDSDGRVLTDFAANNDECWSIAIQADGKILLGGRSIDSTYDFSLARYNLDGSLDNTFDTDGLVTTDFAGSADWGASLFIQPDYRIILAGRSSNPSNTDFAIARYISGLYLGLIDFPIENNSLFIYPNPITDFSQLKYILNKQENISILLADNLGNTIKTFVNNELQSSGEHNIILDIPPNIASGTYYIILETPNGRTAIKLIK
jgi:uncharacterized delta-60 repeat protein